MDGTIIVAKDQLHHFTHPEHPLSLVHLQQPNDKNEDEDEDENEDKDDSVEEEHNHGGQCNLCKEQIWSFHLCYYHCKACDYSLHKFCAELPRALENHPLHHGHTIRFLMFYNESKCFICNLKFKNGAYFYHCSLCGEFMHITCAIMSEYKMHHSSHCHQLEQMFGSIASNCVACGKKHEGVFFQCPTCPWFRINLDCALLPAKLLIQNHTDGTFTHTHPLTLAYSFPRFEIEAKFNPPCRVCDCRFGCNLWIYKCDKCRYYVHVDCATSKRRLGKIYKNFKDDEHPNLLQCPFRDEADNLLKRHMSNHKDGEMLNHEHPLVLIDKQTPVLSLHDPMKRVQLLCDGCVKPIITIPFYVYDDGQCCFVLHEWCAKLPSQVQDHVGHPEHTLFLLPKVPVVGGKFFFGVFKCAICTLPSNGFAYGCTTCEYYVDVNCAFIPKEISHDAHPDHLLSIKIPTKLVNCKACTYSIRPYPWVFHCPSCEFYIHVDCALLLPRVIKHKCDEHPLSLRYEPVENHIGDYFCEICEDEFDPWGWFYHCTACAQSMHTACVPLILLHCESRSYMGGVYEYLNIKFGGTLEIEGHSHRLVFVQGLESDGQCIKCHKRLRYEMIFKCLECKYAFHYECPYYH